MCRTLSTGGQSEYVVVQIESSQNLHFYKLLDNSFKFLTHLKSDSCVLDFDCFEEKLVVLKKTKSATTLDSYVVKNDELVLADTNNFDSPSHIKFFDPIKNFESEGMKNLHKRWFDNVKEYFDRKEARIEKIKAKSQDQIVPVKKQKCESWENLKFFPPFQMMHL